MFLLAYDNTADDNDHSNNVFIHSFKNIFFQELKQKLKTSKLTEEIFPISQLMTQLSNTTISTGQGDDYTTSCLLDFVYFKKITD